MGREALEAASAIPIKLSDAARYGTDLSLMTLEAALAIVEAVPSGAAVLTVGPSLMFAALRAKKELPETVGLGVRVIQQETLDQIWANDWLVVGPTGIALYNPGDS